MSYTLLAMLGIVLAALVDLAVLRTNLLVRKAFWVAYAVVFCFQLVVNGLRIVRYDANRIIGWRLVFAPVEDLLFGFAMVTVTLSLWVWAGRRAARPRRCPDR